MDPDGQRLGPSMENLRDRCGHPELTTRYLSDQERVDRAVSTCQDSVNYTNTVGIRRRRVARFGVTRVDFNRSRSRLQAVRAGAGAAARHTLRVLECV